MTALTINSAQPDFKVSKESIEADLEVEQILNEIDLFSDEYVSPENQNALHEKPKEVTSFPPVFDHASVSADEEEIGAASISVEKMETFSVPNPMAHIQTICQSTPNVTVKVEQSLQVIPETKTEIRSEKPIMVAPRIKIEPGTSPAPAKSNPQNRKRKAAPASPVSVSPEADPKELTEEQMEERRVRNREHAKRSRLRKKSLTHTLQQTVDELKAENRKIREMLQHRIGVQKADNIIEERRSRSLNQFLESLRQPTSRILDEQSTSFLRSLKRKLPKRPKSS